MNDNRQTWDERARALGATRRGVLFKGFTDEANGRLHDWHAWLVREMFAPAIGAEGGAVLDLGCGYGRLSQTLATARPDLFVVGQDISGWYCQRMAEGGGGAVLADLRALPFRPRSMAGAMAITSLMYLDRPEVGAAFAQIAAMLRPGAPLLIVDPGEELRSLIGRLAGNRVASATGGRGFRREEYIALARAAGFEVLGKGGNPRDSALLLATAGGRVGWGLASRLAGRQRPRAGGYSPLALHRWLLLKAPGEGR
ncbi:class I SAM-dependent methyltransferase [Dyella sp. SG609]|uniref:class I SAM-dependent methyltransferase n=1 Tax=Dyella sp. SG609 TaxID=2587018 RepID=UPI0014451192|nr:class I SAM-dependent methyltransferase [Dyella sp. SG609]NKJ22863.1 SAM-dependent methyltransferase [Dyella sp. SG609]